MVHKTNSIMEHILDRDSDLVFLTEMWLTSDSNHVTALVKHIDINFCIAGEKIVKKKQVALEFL